MDMWAAIAMGAFVAAAAACGGLCAAEYGVGGASPASARVRVEAGVAGGLAVATLALLFALRAALAPDEAFWVICTRDGLQYFDARVDVAMRVSGVILLSGLALLVWRRALVLAAAAAFLAAATLLATGPIFAPSPLPPLSNPIVAAHALLTVLGLAGVPALLAIRRCAPADFAPALKLFGRVAPPALAAALASGIWDVWDEGGAPVLVASSLGRVAAFKLLMLAVACGLALKLRFRSSADGAGELAVLSALTVGVLLAAGWLGQQTPGSAPALNWPLPFRLAPAAAFAADIYAPWRLALGLALAAIGAGAAFALRRRRLALALGAAGIVGGGALAAPAVTTPAYPTTYWRPAVAYDAATLARGGRIYAAHCVACHGPHGHGDGPGAKGLVPAPADLTQPHTTVHTMGDMYWWVAHGYPGAAMPAFSDALDARDVWSVATYAMALSLGYQGRLIGEEFAPRLPWLHAIDFQVPYGADVSGPFLARTPGVARLVVLRRACGQAAREFDDAWGGAAHEGLALAVLDLAACTANYAAFRAHGPAAADAFEAYALYRRTLANADADDRRGLPEAMALLIDRFGFVRARWRNDEGTWPPGPNDVLGAARALADEPQINRKGPHDH